MLFEGPTEKPTMHVAVAIGAILVVLGFFFGWVGVDLGPASFSVSGWQLAKLAREHGVHYYLVYLVPIGAAIAGLLAFVDKRAAAKLGLAVGGAFLLWSAVEISRFLWRTTFLGLWLTVLGAIVLLVAGFTTKKSAWD